MAISADTSFPPHPATDPPNGTTPPSGSHPRETGHSWGEHRLGPGLLGLFATLATAAFLTWGLARSALWLDESATVLATQRTWSDLWMLGQGAETPLMPYYVLLKLFCGAVWTAFPASQQHPEVVYRLPSVIVSVLASGLLVAWTRRFSSSRLALATGTMLLLTSGFSRYGQEARPYAAILSLAVVATVLWTVLIDDRRHRWKIAYALSAAAMISLHTLSGGLIAAHGVAALVCPPKGARRPAFWRTCIAGTAAVLLAAPMALVTANNGVGPLYVYPDITPRLTLDIFVHLFTAEEFPLLGLGPIPLLALVGLVRVATGRHRFIARLAACWALVPLVAVVPVLIMHPNLLIARYVLFVVPAWALLAGLGLLALADLGRLVVRNRAGALLVSTVAVGLLAGTLVLQAPSQREIRAPGGHQEDIRPALALAQRPEYAKLRIVSSSRFGAIEVAVYDRHQEDRLVGQKIQRSTSEIWPTVVPGPDVGRVLRQQDRVILLQRTSVDPPCDQRYLPVTTAMIEQCQPAGLKKLGFHVERIEPAGDGWAFAVMQRTRRGPTVLKALP